MTMTDPISDLLTRIRNACSAKHEKVEVPNSKIKIAILEVLKKEGYIAEYNVIDGNTQGIISISLKYTEDMLPVIKRLERVSKPGLRNYVETRKVPRVLSGLGTAIISTSKGVMTGREAKKLNIGGEYLCRVW